ncbi:MAG: hypothetical protein QE285_11385 [Aquabacterium sp.]|nr:hypothetical protein [Aquabacterium sp.]
MHVIFETRDPQAAQLRHLAVTRLQFVLRRVKWLVPRATVRLSDVNGPRGGVDKRCQVALDTDGNGKVVITAQSRDWRSAIDAALARAARALLRLWQRDRSQARNAPRRVPLGICQPAAGRILAVALLSDGHLSRHELDMPAPRHSDHAAGHAGATASDNAVLPGPDAGTICLQPGQP